MPAATLVMEESTTTAKQVLTEAFEGVTWLVFERGRIGKTPRAL